MEVALFVTCLTDTFFPRVGEAVVRVLRHFGCTVRFPERQTCCGQPAFNSGFRDDAREVAQRTIGVLEPHATVVTPSASCWSMIVKHYPELFASEPDWLRRAERLAGRTFEFATFLRDRLGVDLAAHLHFHEPITYHYPCHARAVYSVEDLQGWLERVPGVDLRTPTQRDLCCGFGGVFSIDFPEISGGMLNDKLALLQATGARLVICNEGGCGLHIAGGARKQGCDLRFKHLAECLAESLGLMEAS